MGAKASIGIDYFPLQSEILGMEVDVVRRLPDGSDDRVVGTVVRDDLEEPRATLIELADGSVVLGHESGSYSEAQQGSYLNRRTRVAFHGQISQAIGGTIVRDDMEDPYKIVIKLDAGRFVFSTECLYQPV